jgi:hypothetical protein
MQKISYKKSIFRTFQQILLKWLTNIKVLRRNILNGQKKFKNLIAQINFWKGKDTNTQVIGFSLTK